MEAVDPRDPNAVGEALRGWVSERFASQASLVGVPNAVGGGFDSFIHFVQLAGSGLPDAWRLPLVVRIVPSVDRTDRAQFEAATQTWAADAGYPAPRVLAVLAPEELLGLPTQIIERVPGVTMLDALKRRPWRARAFVDQLAALQLQLHGLDPSTWPQDVVPTALAHVRLSLTRRAVATLGDPALASALERAEALVPRCFDGGDRVLCHGDFHPLNVMVEGPTANVIDWTDAGIGPREADVSRTALLFEVASIAADNAFERAVLRATGPRLARRFRGQYSAVAPLDADRMRCWEALHALHGWAQVQMLHAGSFADASSSDGNEQRVPLELATWLQRRFEASIA
jgi:aminoglycoside phosphotransferase (APT) family kinase protein